MSNDACQFGCNELIQAHSFPGGGRNQIAVQGLGNAHDKFAAELFQRFWFWNGATIF